jgi:hypothetical protein
MMLDARRNDPADRPADVGTSGARADLQGDVNEGGIVGPIGIVEKSSQ